MNYLIYDKTSGMTKANISASCFAEIDTRKNLQPKVVNGEVWHVHTGEPFSYGNARAGMTIIVHTGDFIVKSRG